MDRDTGIKLMQDLLRRMVERKGSDLFITAGFPPAIKVDGEIRPQSERVLTPEQAAVLVRSIMNDKQTKEFDSTKECNSEKSAVRPRPSVSRPSSSTCSSTLNTSRCAFSISSNRMTL